MDQHIFKLNCFFPLNINKLNNNWNKQVKHLHCASFITWRWSDSFFPTLIFISFFVLLLYYQNHYPVPEMPTPTFHWCGDNPRQQQEPDLRSSWDDGRKSNWRDVCHCYPHPRDGSCIPKVWWLSQQLWFVIPAVHPWKQSVSNVKVSKWDPI